MVYCHLSCGKALRDFDLLIMNAVREYLCFRLDSSLDMKSSFLSSQCFSESNRSVDVLHFLWKKTLFLRDESVNPNQPWSIHHSSTLEEELLIICSHSSSSGLPNQTTTVLALQTIPFFSSTVWKSRGHGIKRHLTEICYEDHQWLFWYKAFSPREKEQKKDTNTKI